MLAAALQRQCLAQVYSLQHVAVPGPRSVDILYGFYVFSDKGAPKNVSGPPAVDFSGVVWQTKTPPSAPGHGGVQLAVVRYKEYGTPIDTDWHCSTSDDVV